MPFATAIALAASGSMVAAALLTGLLRRLLMQFNIIDAANARSSHAGEVPRGGGIAFVLVGLAVTAALAARTHASAEQHGATAQFLEIWCAALCVAIAGAIDDARSIGAAPRLLVHLAAGAALAWALLPLPPVELPGGMQVQLGWTLWILLPLATAWSINLTNFMDGIDGIAATHGALVLGFFAGCSAWQGEHELAMVCAVLAGAVAGFLPWNLSRAGRIFMGDAGSGFLGFALVACSILAWRAEAVTAWAAFIAPATFVTDATVTLLRRALQGRRVWQPHRSHAYQHMAQRLRSHHRVTLRYALTDALWCLPLAAAAIAWPEFGAVIALCAYAPLVVIAMKAGAGQESPTLTR